MHMRNYIALLDSLECYKIMYDNSFNFFLKEQEIVNDMKKQQRQDTSDQTKIPLFIFFSWGGIIYFFFFGGGDCWNLL